jgi:hypothetical protein
MNDVTENFEIIKNSLIDDENTCIERCGDKTHNATNSYRIIYSNSKRALNYIRFQDGPIKENGVNGARIEDFIGIMIDRLNQFQNSEFRCRENACAITKLEEALMWLNKRTQDRKLRGVEGTSNK